MGRFQKRKTKQTTQRIYPVQTLSEPVDGRSASSGYETHLGFLCVVVRTLFDPGLQVSGGRPLMTESLRVMHLNDAETRGDQIGKMLGNPQQAIAWASNYIPQILHQLSASSLPNKLGNGQRGKSLFHP